MVEHSRAWAANDPNSPFAGGAGAFKFTVLDAADVIKEGQENFVEAQAKAWRDIRSWADDQEGIVEVQKGGSPNGPGASLPLTENLREQLPGLWLTHGIKSVLDVACGDWNWMRYVDLSGIRNYYGWDVDPELITRCAQRYNEMMDAHPDKHLAHAWFDVRNVADTSFPNVDCILARHILIHFPNDYISDIIDKMRRGHARYLLTSNFPEDTNEFLYDPTRYAWVGYMEHPVNLEIPPFSLSNKIDAIPEQCGPAGVLTHPHELALFEL